MSKANSFKLVLLGESAVGKSSLVLRFVRDEFSDYRESTIGAAFLTQSLQLPNGTPIKFEIWDTAGQERYRSLAPIYFRNSAAAVIVYDVTQSPDASFERAKSWVQTLKRQADPGIIIILVGNKIDLCSPSSDDPSNGGGNGGGGTDKRRVPREMAEKYAKEEGLLFAEASAKTGEGVAELFLEVAKKLPIRSGDAEPAPGTTGGKRGVHLGVDGKGVRDACNC